MTRESQDAMINAQLLRNRAYKDNSGLDRRKALYQYTQPHYSIEDEILGLRPLRDGQSLLDVGCGTGKLLLQAAAIQPNARLVGVDISSGVYRTAQEKAQVEGLNIKFQIGDIQHLPFRDRSFDRITSMHMLYHTPDINQALEELVRVVKKDGLVLITANSKESRKQLGLMKAQAGDIMGREVFTDPNLRFNLENGLEITAAHFENVALVPFESRLRLNDPQPYMDYFDSLREFWYPVPTNEQWNAVISSIRVYIENEIAKKGAFTDRTGFGIIVASHTPIPAQILQRNPEK